MVLRASITAFTHPGLDRGQNEDAVAVGAWVGEGTLWRPWRARLIVDRPQLCVIADGMGGHAGGAVASAAVVRHLAEASGRMLNAAAVDRVIDGADRLLHDRAGRDPALAGMGTTVVGLVLAPERLIWFNVGDSRLYRYREGFLRQLSIDDVPGGGFQQREGPRQSHLLSASLGGRERGRPDPHIGVEEPPPAVSRWLLCSDGVTDMMSPAEMEEAMAADDLDAWTGLFAGVMEAGATDNFSILLVTLDEIPAGEARNGT